MPILSQDAVSTVLRAVSVPTRRRILQLLAPEPKSVGELVAATAISQPGITRHLDVLEQAGLIRRHRDGRLCLCQLRPDGLQPTVLWLRSLRYDWEEAVYGGGQEL